MMKRLAAILFMVMLICASIMGIIFIIPENASADVRVSGSISSDTTWNLTNSPYFVEGNVTVESGVTLTIEPGVQVRFNGSFRLIINGTLNATGSSSLPINFTSNQSTPSKGDWLGIVLKGANNTIDNCQIMFGENPLYITGSNTNNSITNSRIFNNTGDGIYLNNTTNNTFLNITVLNNDGYGFYFNSSDNNNIDYLNISHNEKDGIYLADSDQNSFSYNSLFSNNGTGINLTSSSSSNTIKINTIVSNNKTGIHFLNNSNSNVIARNNITDNLLAGINITNSTGNLIHHNNFDSNGQNGYDSSNQSNAWDNSMEGNWWSDYGGSDGDGDGIGDTPHDISGGGSKDFYPLVNSVNIYAPIIESTDPVNGTENVSVAPFISITFSSEMNTSSAENATSMSGGATPMNFTWSNGNKTMTFNLSVPLSSETIYMVNISKNAKDVAEIQMDLNYSFYFITEDSMPPEITSTIPANGTVNVLITADIVVVFSEEMNTTSVTYTCSPDPVGWSVVWSGGNTTATYSHNDFASETNYTFNITGAKDLAGNDLVAGAVPNPFSFTTEDVVEPEITSTTPVNGTVDVLITADIVVVFSEEMNTTSVTYTCTPDPIGWSVVWSGGNTTATYSHNDFNSETNYTFNITAAKDVAGNDLVAGAVPNPFNFTTVDANAPQITSTTPANGTVDVLITADIVVVFSEEMNTTSVTYTCTPDPVGWSVVWSGGNTTATYSHNDFNSETVYTFNITAAKDVAGNDLVAGAVPNPFTFTTEDAIAPQITSTIPVNGTVDVLITADIVIVFSEEMNTTSVTYTCTPDPVGWTVVWSGGNTTATYSHNDFNSEVAGAVPNPFTFTTEDVIGPEITSTTPVNGTIDVPITADIVVVFNEEMNTTSVTYTCSPDPVGWTVVWSGGNTTATYSHNDFNSETVYTFNITGAKDVAGNDLVAGAVPNPWTFKTEDVIGPEISSTSPVNGTVDVLITADIVVVFNEEMNTTSVTYTCTPDPVGWTVVWSGGNTTATYSHNDFNSEELFPIHGPSQPWMQMRLR
jgi:parallel beta-helix repeat protein